MIKKTLPREIWIGWISSLSEAYNMAIYSFLAPFLAPLLFQEAGSWNAIIFSYSLVFIGYSIFYPAGALYFGYLGDKKGRQSTCIYSTLGLAAATGAMGLIPLNGTEGNAWIYFLALIGLQHFFSGGEYHGSIIFSLEHAETEKNGLLSAMSCLFAVFGIAAANGLSIVASLNQENMWLRICFIVGGLGGLLSYILKYYCRETPAFTAIPEETLIDLGTFSFVKREWRKISGTVLVIGLFMVVYSFLFFFLPLVQSQAMPIKNFDTFHSLIVYGLGLVLAGLIADWIGARKVIESGTILLSVILLPASYFIKQEQTLQLVLTLIACLIIGPIHSWILDQFQVHERCRGIFISSGIAMSIFGGSTVPICIFIYEQTHSLMLCAVYPLLLCLLAFKLVVRSSAAK